MVFAADGRSCGAVVRRVPDDRGLVHAVTLDGLHRIDGEKGDWGWVVESLEDKKGDVSSSRRGGILGALREFQIIRVLPDAVVDSVLKVLESMVFDSNDADVSWIIDAFAVVGKQFSFYRMRRLISLAFAPFPLPDRYTETYFDVLEGYVRASVALDEMTGTYLETILLRLEEAKEAGEESLSVVQERLLKFFREFLSCEATELTGGVAPGEGHRSNDIPEGAQKEGSSWYAKAATLALPILLTAGVSGALWSVAWPRYELKIVSPYPLGKEGIGEVRTTTGMASMVIEWEIIKQQWKRNWRMTRKATVAILADGATPLNEWKDVSSGLLVNLKPGKYSIHVTTRDPDERSSIGVNVYPSEKVKKTGAKMSGGGK